MLVAISLIQRGNLTPTEAIKLIRKKRKNALNETQVIFLENYSNKECIIL
jgi:protein-tyrosine phosphatase